MKFCFAICCSWISVIFRSACRMFRRSSPNRISRSSFFQFWLVSSHSISCSIETSRSVVSFFGWFVFLLVLGARDQTPETGGLKLPLWNLTHVSGLSNGPILNHRLLLTCEPGVRKTFPNFSSTVGDRRKLSVVLILECIGWLWTDASCQFPNRRPEIRHNMWDRQAAWSPSGWWWPCVGCLIRNLGLVCLLPVTSKTSSKHCLGQLDRHYHGLLHSNVCSHLIFDVWSFYATNTFSLYLLVCFVIIMLTYVSKSQ